MKTFQLTSKEWWGNPDNAQIWIGRVAKKEREFNPEANTTLQSTEALLSEVSNYQFDSFLEVGAGNGRLIGALSKQYPEKKFSSVDINPKLSEYVKEQYPLVDTYTADVIGLPFADNTFDLVYTHQVLQHIAPNDIQSALNEIRRVCKKEFWLLEGWDGHRVREQVNGMKVHPADGGSFSYYYDKFPGLTPYSSEFLKSPLFEFIDIKIYKVKK